MTRGLGVVGVSNRRFHMVDCKTDTKEEFLGVYITLVIEQLEWWERHWRNFSWEWSADVAEHEIEKKISNASTENIEAVGVFILSIDDELMWFMERR